MKRMTTMFLSALVSLNVFAWTPAGANLRTKWGEEVSPDNARIEYPRPQMVRQEWLCLNGLWDYAITSVSVASMPEPDGKILVPFCVESSLSGVGVAVFPNQTLWYKTNIIIPQKWAGKRILLHFDAVDWKAEIYLAGEKIGEHTGGYTSFSLDITGVSDGQELVVKVWDPTDEGKFKGPHGKQKIHNLSSQIYYTPVTGIWQSVWLEAVPMQAYVKEYNVVTDLSGTVTVTPEVEGQADEVKVELIKPCIGYNPEKPSGSIAAKGKGKTGESVRMTVKSPKLWTPDTPYLYGIRIKLIKDGKVIDKVEGYTAIRETGIKTDDAGVKRLALNDEILFQTGTLDQGWWPDGLYTAPTAEALAWDVEQTKALGFNMIRKHVKVEPSRWYYDCDRIGMLVWQDMPSMDRYKERSEWAQGVDKYGAGKDTDMPQSMKDNFYKEWAEVINQFKKFQCIYCWVPFNEAWGQFDTKKVADYTKSLDPTRLVNAASGGNWIKGAGDIIDSHRYPAPKMRLVDPEMVNVLGEYGGIGRTVEGHTWFDSGNWGYVELDNEEKCTMKYIQFSELMIQVKQENRCSAAVYTQFTDVERETNGLFTYDRKVLKFDPSRLKEANQRVINAPNIKE